MILTRIDAEQVAVAELRGLRFLASLRQAAPSAKLRRYALRNWIITWQIIGIFQSG